MRQVGACQKCENFSMMVGYTWCWVRCVTGAWLRQMTELNRDSSVGKRDGQRASSKLAALLAGAHAGENRRVRLIGQNGTITGAMYSPRLVKELLNTLGKQLVDSGRLNSVSLYSTGPTADFPVLDTKEWQEDDYDQQGNLLDPVNVKERKRGDRLGVETEALRLRS